MSNDFVWLELEDIDGLTKWFLFVEMQSIQEHEKEIRYLGYVQPQMYELRPWNMWGKFT